MKIPIPAWTNRISARVDGEPVAPAETFLNIIAENIFLKRVALGSLAISLIALVGFLYGAYFKEPLVIAISAAGGADIISGVQKTTPEIARLARSTILDLYEQEPWQAKDAKAAPSYVQAQLWQRISGQPRPENSFRRFIAEEVKVNQREDGAILIHLSGLKITGISGEDAIQCSRTKVTLAFMKKSRTEKNPYGLELSNLVEELLETP